MYINAFCQFQYLEQKMNLLLRYDVLRDGSEFLLKLYRNIYLK